MTEERIGCGGGSLHRTPVRWSWCGIHTRRRSNNAVTGAVKAA
nr:hypothetical protein [Micromonospora sp. DSM 115978]